MRQHLLTPLLDSRTSFYIFVFLPISITPLIYSKKTGKSRIRKIKNWSFFLKVSPKFHFSTLRSLCVSLSLRVPAHFLQDFFFLNFGKNIRMSLEPFPAARGDGVPPKESQDHHSKD